MQIRVFRHAPRRWGLFLVMLTTVAAAGPVTCQELAQAVGKGHEPPVGGTPAPSLGHKLQEVIVLRTLLTLRFSRTDLESVLPLLRSLQEADQTLQMRSEQALDAELRALLTAPVEGRIPPDSGEQIRQEVARYQERSERLWANAAQKVGVAKAETLRRIVSGPHPPQPGGPLGPGAGLTQPPDPAEGPPGKQPLPGGKSPRKRPGLDPHLPLAELLVLLDQRRTLMAR